VLKIVKVGIGIRIRIVERQGVIFFFGFRQEKQYISLNASWADKLVNFDHPSITHLQYYFKIVKFIQILDVS